MPPARFLFGLGAAFAEQAQEGSMVLGLFENT
jgi:hypothetical protein